MSTTPPGSPAPSPASPVTPASESLGTKKPRPKSVPKEATGLENHPTANPNFRGKDPSPKSAPTGKPAAS